MARIQALSSGQKIKTNVNVAAKKEISVAGAALQTAGNVTQALAGAQMKRDKAEATNFSNNGKLKLLQASQDIELELAPKYKDNPNGYAQAYSDRLETARAGIGAKAPSEAAGNMFKSDSEGFTVRSNMVAKSTENKKKAYKYVSDMDKSADVASQIFYNDPDPMKAAVNISSYKAQQLDQTELTISAKQSDKIQANYTKKVRDGVLKGMIDKNFSSITNAKMPLEEQYKAIDNFVKGNEATAPLFEGMTPSERLSFTNKAKNQMKMSFQKEKSHLNQRVDLAEQRMNLGNLDVSTAKGRAEFGSIIQDVKTSHGLDTFEKSMKLRELGVAAIKQGVQSDIALLGDDESVAEAQKYVDLNRDLMKDADPEVAATLDAESIDIAQEAIATAKKEFEKNPIGVMTKSDPNMGLLQDAMQHGNAGAYNSFKSKANAIYDAKKTPASERKYISPEFAKKFKSSFMDSLKSKKHDIAAQQLTDIENMTNGQSYQALKDLGIPENYVAIGEASVGNRKELVATMAAQKDGSLEKAFRDAGFGDESKGNSQGIREKLSDNDYFKAISTQNDQSLMSAQNASAFMDVAVAQYKANRVSGMDEDEAMESAWKSFSEGQEVIDGGDTKSKLVVPTAALGGADPELLETYISQTTGGDKHSMRAILGDVLENTDVAGNEDNMAENIAGNGFWTYNKADGRMYLRAMNGATSAPVRGKGSNGKPGDVISFTPQEMAKRVSKDMKQTAEVKKKEVMAQKQFIAARYSARAAYYTERANGTTK